MLELPAPPRIVSVMRTNLLIAAVASLLNLSASARVGETVAECDARYGKPVLVEGLRRTYAMKGFVVIQEFENGKAAVSVYKSASGKDLTEGEKTVFVNAEKSFGKWIELPRFSVEPQEWHSTIGKGIAVYSDEMKMLMICSKDYMEAKLKREAEEKQKKMGGF
jgi:hypothetical protein